MQGQLRDEPLTVEIRTQCAHCSDPIVIETDSELNHRVIKGGSELLIFSPLVDFARLTDPSIIHAF